MQQHFGSKFYRIFATLCTATGRRTRQKLIKNGYFATDEEPETAQRWRRGLSQRRQEPDIGEVKRKMKKIGG